jgi:PAT family beta-lactamase induction signal transducer AmpG
MPLPKIFADRRLFVITALGFQSGLPLALSGFTLRQWLTEGGISLAAIGLTANIGLSYTLKFLWAPALDELRPPLGLARLGQRRGWLLLFQPFLLASLAALALADAAARPAQAIVAAAFIAFFSATQDIAIDAWRIEAFEPREQGAALAGYVWGYRVAMLVSGAGVIYAAGHLGWHGALGAVGVLAALGVIPVLLATEAPAARRPSGAWLRRAVHAVKAPLGDFLLRAGAFVVLAYVALFNLGEAMAGVMLAPFYAHLGFDRAAVATAIGPFSLVATMSGIAAGGALVARLGLGRSLILTGFVQMGAMGLYVFLSLHPGDHAVLYGTVVTEAFVQGLASASFLAYLSGLCRREFAATQYALLSSVAPVASHTVGGFSGFLVEAVGWTWFYAAAMAAALPAMLIMLHILRRYPVRGDAA